MKKLNLHLKETKSSRQAQEYQTVAIIILAVAFVVMACTIAVLLAQVDGHRKSIENLYYLTTNLPTSEMTR